MAREFDVDIDMHLEFGPTPDKMTFDHVCRRTEEYRYGGRVAIGHVTRVRIPTKSPRQSEMMSSGVPR
jgi:cytosine deaminase